MTKNVVYKKPKWFRRVSSALIDLIATFVLALLLLFATTPISKSLFDANNAQEAIDNYLLESKLYYIDVSGEIKLDNSVSNFDDRLTYFYNTYTDKLDEYSGNNILDLALFNKELEITKYLVKQAIHERGNIIIQSIVDENKRNMIVNEEKYIAKMELIDQLNQAIKDGNDELAVELFNTLNKKHNNNI